MQFVVKYLSKYKIESILAPCCKLFEAILELLVPLIVASIIDVGIKEYNDNYIWKMCVFVFVLAVLGVGVSLVGQYFSAKAAVGTAGLIREDLAKKILGFTREEYEVMGGVTLLTRMTSDVNQVQNGINWTLRLVMRSPFIVGGAIVMSAIVSLKMSIVIILVTVLVVVVLYIILKINGPKILSIQNKVDAITSQVKSNYNGARVFRSFGLETSEEREFNTRLEELYDEQIIVGRISNLLNPITFVIVNLGLVAVIYFGGIEVSVGGLSTGQIVALTNYLSQVLVELIKFANVIALLMKAFPSAGRIENVINYESKDKEYRVEKEEKFSQESAKRDSSCDEIISINNLTFKYPRSTTDVLEDITFSVRKGENVGVIGGTGSGKSTLMKIIMGHFELENDKVLLDGCDISNASKEEITNKLSYVPQNSNSFKGTIEENLTMGKDANVEEALRLSCFDEVVESKEEGVDMLLLKNASNLSGGQRKRFALARALVKKPELILVDDVTNALDFITEKKLINNIFNKRDMAVLIATQRVSACINADKIYVLDNGRIVGVGNHEELLENCELYREIFHVQFPEKEAEYV